MINILRAGGWDDYELLDSGKGMRLERFGRYLISKPDPQAIWNKSLTNKDWESAEAIFDDGHAKKWKKKIDLPEKWLLHYKNISFYARLTPFKHLGFFPEQMVHWEFIHKKISSEPKRNLQVLNLFGYTGIASLVAAKEGAKVTHVDASRPAITFAKENQHAAGLPENSIRWILDDVIKFLRREVKRGNFYDGIIMDPPVYGHGPNGERWDFSKDFPLLMSLCNQVLARDALFVIVNAYAISASSLMLENILNDFFFEREGAIISGELVLTENSGRLLSTGIFSQWSKN